MSAIGIYIESELSPLLSYTSYLSTADTAVQLSPNSTALLLQRHNICFSLGCIMAARVSPAAQQRHRCRDGCRHLQKTAPFPRYPPRSAKNLIDYYSYCITGFGTRHLCQVKQVSKSTVSY